MRIATLTQAQRQRLIRAHRIDVAENVHRLDFAPRSRKADEPMKSPVVDAVAGIFVAAVLAGAALALLWLPGAP